jgi:hypothetical protein
MTIPKKYGQIWNVVCSNWKVVTSDEAMASRTHENISGSPTLDKVLRDRRIVCFANALALMGYRVNKQGLVWHLDFGTSTPLIVRMLYRFMNHKDK